MTNREYIFNTGKIPACIWHEIAKHTTVPHSPRIYIHSELNHGAEYLGYGSLQMDLSYFWGCGFGGFASVVLHECIHWEQELRYGRWWFKIRYWWGRQRYEDEAQERTKAIIPTFSNKNAFLMDMPYKGD